MSALPTRIENEAARPLTPLEIFDLTAAREKNLSRMLMLYITNGLVSMYICASARVAWRRRYTVTATAVDAVNSATAAIRRNRDVGPEARIGGARGESRIFVATVARDRARSNFAHT